MASLADTLAAQRKRPGTRCTLRGWLRARPDLDDILDAFRDGRVSSFVLLGWLEGQGLEVTRNTLDHHRRGACTTCNDDGLDLRRRT